MRITLRFPMSSQQALRCPEYENLPKTRLLRENFWTSRLVVIIVTVLVLAISVSVFVSGPVSLLITGVTHGEDRNSNQRSYGNCFHHDIRDGRSQNRSQIGNGLPVPLSIIQTFRVDQKRTANISNSPTSTSHHDPLTRYRVIYRFRRRTNHHDSTILSVN